MDRITGDDTIELADGKAGFRDRNMSAGRRGTVVKAAWMNDVQEELVGLIEVMGITPEAGTRDQLQEVLRRLLQQQYWTHAAAAGTATAVTATLKVAPTGLVDGLTVSLRMKYAASGATTLAVNGLAAKSVLRQGQAVPTGAWVAGEVVRFTYSSTLAAWSMQAGGGDDGDNITRNYYTFDGLLYAAATGSANALVAAFDPAFTAYNSNMRFVLHSPYTNAAGGMTLNVDGLGVRPLIYRGDDPPAGLFGVNKPQIVIALGSSLVVVGAPPEVAPTTTTVAAAHMTAVDFPTAGTYTWACPAGINRVRYVLTGAGGGGAGVNGSGDTGGSGGAGGTCEGWYAVTPGQEYEFVIGAGGASGQSESGARNGGDGGSSTAFGRTATGGGGGTNNGSTARGGIGGTASGGTINVRGGDGTDGHLTANEYISGVGGASRWGGGGKGGRGLNGAPGRAPGSGGAGASYLSGGTGGAGAPGILTLDLYQR